jgi:hypothetical protein
MKLFNAVLLAGLFAATCILSAQAENLCEGADLDIKILKVVDSNIKDRDRAKFTAFLQFPGKISAQDLIKENLEVTLVSFDGENVEEELTSLDFGEGNCKLHRSGKSVVCKEDNSSIKINEVRRSCLELIVKTIYFF